MTSEDIFNLVGASGPLIIGALGDNGEAGNGDALPWPRIPEDFQHYRRFTVGQTSLIGYRTWANLPLVAMLNRSYIVACSGEEKAQNVLSISLRAGSGEPMLESYPAVGWDETWDLALETDPNIRIVGGPKVWEQYQRRCKYAVITRVEGKWPNTARFELDPAFERKLASDWNKSESSLYYRFEVWENGEIS